MPKVFIAYPNNSYKVMFEKRGWDVVADKHKADLIQFIGGPDVSPSYYGEEKHRESRCVLARDALEKKTFNYFHKKKPMAGICRGGQFLNVMCGGRMYQHHSGHPRSHLANVTGTKKWVTVSSTHHQLMIPNLERGSVVLQADESVIAERMEGEMEVAEVPEYETEAILYKDDRVLCFQPHPEFSVYDEEMSGCEEIYFSLLGGIL